MSDRRTSISALVICATRAARRSLSPKRIAAVAMVALLVAGAAAREVIGQRVEPGAVDLAILADQKGRADLDDEPAGGGQRPGGGGRGHRLFVRFFSLQGRLRLRLGSASFETRPFGPL